MNRYVDVGDLARIYLLDERQFSDVPPCRDGDPEAEDFGDCAERLEDRTLLGADQEAWFTEASGSSTATWNLIGNPVVLGGIDGGNDTDGAAYYLDTWDGYPTARHRFIEQLAAIDNPVVLTGDYHAGMLIDVHERPFEPDTAIVATELMSPAISSPLFPADVTERSPQVRRQLNGHGYLVLDVTPDRVHASFRLLDDVSDPGQRHLDAARLRDRRRLPRPPPSTPDPQPPQLVLNPCGYRLFSTQVRGCRANRRNLCWMQAISVRIQHKLRRWGRTWPRRSEHSRGVVGPLVGVVAEHEVGAGGLEGAQHVERAELLGAVVPEHREHRRLERSAEVAGVSGEDELALGRADP